MAEDDGRTDAVGLPVGSWVDFFSGRPRVFRIGRTAADSSLLLEAVLESLYLYVTVKVVPVGCSLL